MRSSRVHTVLVTLAAVLAIVVLVPLHLELEHHDEAARAAHDDPGHTDSDHEVLTTGKAPRPTSVPPLELALTIGGAPAALPAAPVVVAPKDDVDPPRSEPPRAAAALPRPPPHLLRA